MIRVEILTQLLELKGAVPKHEISSTRMSKVGTLTELRVENQMINNDRNTAARL